MYTDTQHQGCHSCQPDLQRNASWDDPMHRHTAGWGADFGTKGTMLYNYLYYGSTKGTKLLYLYYISTKGTILYDYFYYVGTKGIIL